MVPFLFHAVLPEKKSSLAGAYVIQDYQVEYCHDELILFQIVITLFGSDIQNATMKSAFALLYLVQSLVPYCH